MLDRIILGMVQTSCATGYDIKKRIENGIGVFYRASYGSLYPTLRKLVEKRFLTAREEAQGGRKKIFYSITKEGERYFLDWLSEPMSVPEGTTAHLAKVYFFDLLPPEIRNRQLTALEFGYESYLSKLEALEKHFLSLENRDSFYYKLSTLYYGISVTRTILQWCGHIRAGKPLESFCKGEETW